MIDPRYRLQVDLLLQILPFVAQEPCFALKGGTAINLFVQDMPRFSVDIDLTYVPFQERALALKEIASALDRIAERLKKGIPALRISRLPQSDGHDAKMVCQLHQAIVKIEVNTVMRGHVWPLREMALVPAAQALFEKFASIQVVSQAELYGGKLCAALDRQHPRDLFDVQQLLAGEGVTDQVLEGFLVALLSHPRPIHEVIYPNFQDQRHTFQTQFVGMTLRPFSYDDFEATRRGLVAEIHAKLTDNQRSFLLSFKQGEPDWDLFPLGSLKQMPAIQWKLGNILKLKQQNPIKHAQQLQALESRLNKDRALSEIEKSG